MTAETRARAADIVERLRDWSRQQGADFWAQDDAALLNEAAAEIERLREERREAAMQALADQAQLEMHLAKIERLRAALRFYADADLIRWADDVGDTARAALERAP